MSGQDGGPGPAPASCRTASGCAGKGAARARGCAWRQRFDRDDIIATDRKPRGIATGACANVEDRGTRRGEQIEKRCVDFFECERLVLVDQLECVLLVVENGRHQARW